MMQSRPSSLPHSAAALQAQLDRRLAEFGFAKLPESELPAVFDAWVAIHEHAAMLAQAETRRKS